MGVVNDRCICQMANPLIQNRNLTDCYQRVRQKQGDHSNQKPEKQPIYKCQYQHPNERVH